MHEGLGTAEVARATGLTVRQVDYWTRRGLVVPSLQHAAGSGTRRRFSSDDLVQFYVIRHLRGSGWSLQRIGAAVGRLREVMADPHPLRTTVLFDGRGTLLALCKTADGERILLDALSHTGQRVMSIVLTTLFEDGRRLEVAQGVAAGGPEARSQ